MKKLIRLIPIMVLPFAFAAAQDAVKVDPAHHKVLFENEQVRVLELRIKPGEKTPMHSHSDYVVYAVGNAATKFTYPDGTTRNATLKRGEALWRKGESHAAENQGKEDIHVVMVELKKPSDAERKASLWESDDVGTFGAGACF